MKPRRVLNSFLARAVVFPGRSSKPVRCADLSPLFATLTKTPGGVGVFFPFWNQPAPSALAMPESPLTNSFSHHLASLSPYFFQMCLRQSWSSRDPRPNSYRESRVRQIATLAQFNAFPTCRATRGARGRLRALFAVCVQHVVDTHHALEHVVPERRSHRYQEPHQQQSNNLVERFLLQVRWIAQGSEQDGILL